MKPRVWIDSVPHGERRPRSFIASDLGGSKSLGCWCGFAGTQTRPAHPIRPRRITGEHRRWCRLPRVRAQPVDVRGRDRTSRSICSRFPPSLWVAPNARSRCSRSVLGDVCDRTRATPGGCHQVRPWLIADRQTCIRRPRVPAPTCALGDHRLWWSARQRQTLRSADSQGRPI